MNIYYGSGSIQDTQYLLGYLILTKKKTPRIRYTYYLQFAEKEAGIQRDE